MTAHRVGGLGSVKISGHTSRRECWPLAVGGPSRIDAGCPVCRHGMLVHVPDSVWLSAEEEAEVQRVASAKHLPASTLVRSWIPERLDRNAQPDLPHSATSAATYDRPNSTGRITYERDGEPIGGAHAVDVVQERRLAGAAKASVHQPSRVDEPAPSHSRERRTMRSFTPYPLACQRGQRGRLGQGGVAGREGRYAVQRAGQIVLVGLEGLPV